MSEKIKNFLPRSLSITLISSIAGVAAIYFHLHTIKKEYLFLDAINSGIGFIYIIFFCSILVMLAPLTFAAPSWFIIWASRTKEFHLISENQYFKTIFLCCLNSILFLLLLIIYSGPYKASTIILITFITVTLAMLYIEKINLSPNVIKNKPSYEKAIFLALKVIFLELCIISSSFIISVSLNSISYEESTTGLSKRIFFHILAAIIVYIPAFFYQPKKDTLFKIASVSIGCLIYITLFFIVIENSLNRVSINMAEKINLMEKTPREYLVTRDQLPMILKSWNEDQIIISEKNVTINARSLLDTGHLIVLCPVSISLETEEIVKNNNELDACLPFFEGNYSKGRKILDK